MGHSITVICDRAGCSERIVDSRQMSVGDVFERDGWRIEHWDGNWPVYACPKCLAGRPEGEMRIIHGAKNLLEGIHQFENSSDCYLVPCADREHLNDGCLIHIFGDGDDGMDGPYVQILSSGCGSYHAQMVDLAGTVLVPTFHEDWD